MSDTGISVYKDIDGIYCFDFPENSDYFSNSFYDSLEMIDYCQYAEAEPILRHIVETCPDHIDAIFHLALTLKNRGCSVEALALTEYAVNRGKSYLPKDFEPGVSKLPYDILDNRGYLRACHGLGLEYLERERYQEAVAIFKEILAMNPEDNQAIRELLTLCYFELKYPKEIIKLCDKYPEDTLPSTLWGRALALYQLRRFKEASYATIYAFKTLPKAGKRLLKKQNKPPKELSKLFVARGGDDEAYYFKKQFGKFWNETPDALPFLKDQISQ